MATTNQSNRYNAGWNPISKFTPKRVLQSNERGYAEPGNVSIKELENIKVVVQGGQSIFRITSINDL